MAKVRIVTDGPPASTRIFVDDVEQRDVSGYELRQAADGDIPQLVLIINALHIDIEAADAAVVRKHPNAVEDAATRHAFELVNQTRVVQAIGGASDVTDGVNIPRMALMYVVLPVDVRLSMLVTLGLITDDERRRAAADDDVRHTLEKDALGRAIEQAAITALNKAIIAATAASKQQPA